MKYCILRAKAHELSAGTKAPGDIAQICSANGYQIIHWGLFPFQKSALYKKVWLLLHVHTQWLKIYTQCKKDDLVLYQHPSYGYKPSISWIRKCKKKGIKFIALIHDLESLRKGIENSASFNAARSNLADNAYLKEYDAVICHNDRMRTYLINCGFVPEKLVSLEIFDYLTDGKLIDRKRSEKASIAIAGNLAVEKSQYIYDFLGDEKQNDLIVNLYGIRYKETGSKTLVYHGSFGAEELCGVLEGDYGLVWDGNSPDGCLGNTGEYLKYNNPHKTSLFLASGMPVIVWSQSAMADFVRKYKVGIIVDNLYELSNMINNVTDQEYAEICENTKKVASLLRSGYFLKTALGKCEEIIKTNE